MSVRDRLVERLSNSRVARFALRVRMVAGARGAARRRPRDAASYLFRSREVSNFTYELRNMDELVGCVAEALAVDASLAREAAGELAADTALRSELAAALAANPRRDNTPRYGYRYIYYCIVRIARPGVVFEVGTHDGLGAAVLLRALERNREEGDPGTLVTLDATPHSGWLIPARFAGRYAHELGDVSATLAPLIDRHGCDFLIDDIGFAYERKPFLFETAFQRARGPLVLASEFPPRTASDPPTVLARVADDRGGRYAEFNEVPEGHFWPGHTQGVAAFEAAGAAG